jgi:SAM-dependent methyltransferase
MTTWPKKVPALPPALEDKRDRWHQFWLEHYPARYSFVSDFTETFLRSVGPSRTPERILEVGPGPTSAIRKLMTKTDAYRCCECDPHFCEILRQELGDEPVICADIQRRVPMEGRAFDRIVAAHILEHLPDLPAALDEVSRLMKPDAVFDVVIPCEGSPLYALGRSFTSARTFRRHFGSGFREIMRAEHVNTAGEIVDELKRRFRVEHKEYFPFSSQLVGTSINLLAGFRLRQL